MTHAPWPDLDYAAGVDTLHTLHLFTQIVGKVRLAQTPWLNHSWSVPLYVSPRGMTTGLIPHGTRAFDMEFDLIDSVLRIRTDAAKAGMGAEIPLPGLTVADFHGRVLGALDDLGLPVRIDGAPNELPVAVPFAQDHAPRTYDPAQATAFFRVLLIADRNLEDLPHRIPRQGQPDALLLGQFRPRRDPLLRPPRAAPPRRRAAPPRRRRPRSLLPRSQQRRLLARRSRLRGSGVLQLRLPGAAGFREAKLDVAGARFDAAMGEYVLPWAAARAAEDPDAAVMGFLAATYAAAADGGGWDREVLECGVGEAGRVRVV